MKIELGININTGEFHDGFWDRFYGLRINTHDGWYTFRLGGRSLSLFSTNGMRTHFGYFPSNGTGKMTFGISFGGPQVPCVWCPWGTMGDSNSVQFVDGKLIRMRLSPDGKILPIMEQYETPYSRWWIRNFASLKCQPSA